MNEVTYKNAYDFVLIDECIVAYDKYNQLTCCHGDCLGVSIVDED